MPGSLNGKNCIITGASRGLGAEVARRLWQEGASLLLVARNLEGLKSVAGKLEARPDQQVHLFKCDLMREGAAEEIVLFARSVFNRIDVLVNNAAIQGPIGCAWDTDPAAWREALQVNLLSPVSLSTLCVREMIPERRGKIISISGGGATGSRPNFSSYAVAKTGLVRFSEILAEELMEYNIQVNCVAPGAMATDMLAAIVDAGPEIAGNREFDVANRVKETSGGTLERAARLVLFLAADTSDGLTGRLISAAWDPWERFPDHLEAIMQTDIYTLRRIVPRDRKLDWGDKE